MAENAIGRRAGGRDVAVVGRRGNRGGASRRGQNPMTLSSAKPPQPGSSEPVNTRRTSSPMALRGRITSGSGEPASATCWENVTAPALRTSTLTAPKPNPVRNDAVALAALPTTEMRWIERADGNDRLN